MRRPRRAVAAAAAATAVAAGALAGLAPAQADTEAAPTATPIKHVVVIFGENVSFDHYFGTYPHAANTDGTPFHAAPGTPRINGLEQKGLLTHNPNTFADGSTANPKRLGPGQAVTCDQDHGYTNEQKAYDGGAMDKFVQYTDKETCDSRMHTAPGLVMDYFDGNTVTGLWNYAQRFAMSDNSYNTTFGPSTPGALNLVSGQTGDAVNHATANGGDGHVTTDPTYGVRNPDATGTGTVINDPDPYFDKCSNPTHDTVEMKGRNIGDMLNARGVSWGWFEGGFHDCTKQHANVAGVSSSDYIPHHEPFQYYKSTAHPDHTPPASVAEIGHDGQANHQYDMSDWYDALRAHDLPAVSFLKAPGYQDGHAAYSDPVDEQHYVVDVMNKLQKSPEWSSTAVVLAYDDSDGWYDHQASPIANASRTADDALNGPGECTHTQAGGTTAMLDGFQDRCGYGPRLPLLVLSPFAKRNAVDHTVTDQSSILRFVEDNWLGGERIKGSYDHLAGSLNGMFAWKQPVSRPLFLDPSTGAPASETARHHG
ncbi:MAG: phospholipase C [Nocardioidaceae bacterium]